jgi:hypothetical protein
MTEVPVSTGQTAPPIDGGRAPVPEPGPDARDDARSRSLAGYALSGAVLIAIVVAGLYLRVKNNDYGLPYVYNYDEATHFTNHAVSFFGGDFNPGYFQNPSAFTYVVFMVLKAGYGVLGLGGLDQPSVARQFSFDPTPIWATARTTAAVLATMGVAALFFVGRSLWRDDRVGLASAAVLAFSFLSVVYGRIAVTDVGTFLPIAVATWATVKAYEHGKLWQYLVAGLAVGVAIGFKYTAGLAILPLLLVAGARAWRDRDTGWLKRSDLRYAVFALVGMTVAFAITNPYFFIHPVSALYQLKQQAAAAGGSEKLGQDQVGGFRYYVESLGWGFGYAAALFAIVGAFFEIRRDRIRGIALILFPIALYLYMGTQTRYFGRWLLPMYPVIALLAGVGIVRLAQLIPGRSRVLQGAAVAVVTALVMLQPALSDVRTMRVLGKEDTRQLARDYLVKNYPISLRAVIEPAVPTSFYHVDRSTTGKRQFVRGFIRDIRRAANVDAPDGTSLTYAATLNPGAIDQYRSKGFCIVVTMSLIRGRAENAKVKGALAYYDRLERESKLVYSISPYDKGAKPVPLHFDFSYNYYPSAFYRPGPEVKVYRLNNCRQQTGKVPNEPVGTKGLEKGMGSSFIQGGND